MSKKIKYIAAFIIFIIAIILSKSSFALTVSRSSHIDKWTEDSEFFAAPYPNSATSLGNTFCVEKGGAIRWTPAVMPTSLGDKLSYVELHGHNKCPNYQSISTYEGIEKMITEGITKIINSEISILDDSEANQSKGIWARYGNGNYSFKEYSVAEDIVGVSKPFTKTQVYKQIGTYEYKNNYISYLLSSSSAYNPQTAFGLKQGNYSGTVSDIADAQLVQDAIWCSDLNIGERRSSPTQALLLLREAQDYENYVNVLNSYNPKFEKVGDTLEQVIVNRNTGNYIIGPYKIEYPDDTRFSFIEEIYITDENGNVLTTPRVICSSGNYPRSGEIFFLEFNANEAGNPQKVSVKVDFAYLSLTYGKYTHYTGEGEIHQLVGRLKKDQKTEANIVKVLVGYKPKWDPNLGKWVPDITKPIYDYQDCIVNMYWGEIEDEKIGKYWSQDLIEVLDINRNWARKSILSKSIDLTMELGGYVWEDNPGGKETIANGVADSGEKRIPNIKVTLYSSDGKQIATTKTDNNGTYKFTKLDAMKQYYVKFTYNGQYYQPTFYSSSETWGKEGWKTNSNGTDIRNERISYNAKFASIGSSPANYSGSAGYNETFTKKQLMGYTLQPDGTYKQTREPVVDTFLRCNEDHVHTSDCYDTFGTLVVETSNDATTNKMIQYVKDCLIDSYTGNGDGKFDLYPVPDVFVIDIVQYPSMLTPKAQPLYDTAYYINQGYSRREMADLALKKDIDNVRLEINGQTHKYTYDAIENKENKDKTWDIALRLSDIVSGAKYYDEEYTREIYTSDYLYKASMYGDAEKYGKSKSDELEVYITYKIMVKNQSQSIRCRVDEIVDYYDEDLIYIPERSYIEFKTGVRKNQKYAVNATEVSKYNNIAGTTTRIDGYNNLYIQGLAEGAQRIDDNGNNIGEANKEGIYLIDGETPYIYLTFKVKKDTIDNEDYVRLDEEIETGKEIGVGKENIIEINGYSTIYAPGTQVPNVGDVSGKVAGIVDRDSNPGNLEDSEIKKDNTNKNVYAKFEDDTDKAPNIKIKLDRDDNANRVISGVVWEDERENSNNATAVGNGIRDNNETLINGVTVQLVELMDNGTEYVWREFGDNSGSGTGSNTIGKGSGSGNITSETPIINAYNIVKNYDFAENQKGAYAFKSFIPGKYVVRFIYGDTVRTVLPNDVIVNGENGNNEKSYNGQDYKSTTYQTNIAQNKTYEWKKESSWINGQEIVGETLTKVFTFKADASNNETTNATINENNQKGYLYDITTADTTTLTRKENASDAKDIESIRNKVIDYSDNNVTNYIAEVLASHKKEYQDDNSYKTANDKKILLKDLILNTQMTAETGLMVIEFEYDRNNTDIKNAEENNSIYKVQNVDLGLEERPKAQLVIDKEVTNVKLTLADGSTLFDAKQAATNVLWKDHEKYKLGYNENMLNSDKFGNIENIRNKNAQKVGLIQLSMDEELMHGATIKISYKITVTNVGEVDYKENSFYYTGKVADTKNIVKTCANQVIDYVANNLQFNKDGNANWNVITLKEIEENGLVNNSLKDKLEQFNTIIVTNDLSKELVPQLYKDKINKAETASVEVPLVLTQLITSENNTDDLTYQNIVEIVNTSNNVGRRHEYSVVGNQDPTNTKPQELDSDIAEVVKILPPFGNAGIYIIIATMLIIGIGMLIGGIIFIKKKVLK